MGNRALGRTDRRGAIRLALAAAIAPSLAWRQANAQDVQGGLIAPPTHPMTYRRTVSRDLVDGNSFTVIRNFAVEFRRFSGGYMVHGQQGDVSVDAPQQLAQFADIEAARDESDMFPLALDSFGLILSRERQLTECPSVEEAVARALAALRDQSLPQEERASFETFVAAMHVASQQITAHLPIDLFVPGRLRRDERNIALPDGTQGRVLTSFGGERDSATGLMRAASREVVTEVDDSRRITRESWILAAT